MKTCKLDGCDKKRWAYGFCSLHGNRWRQHGDPLKVLQIQGDDHTRFDSYVEKVPFSTCWYWVGALATFGYGTIEIAGTQWTCHRYAYDRWIAPIPEGLHVLHKCDTPCCVNPDHLEVGTHQRNMQQKIDRNRQLRGSGVGTSKLKESQVLEIRKTSGTLLSIAKEYGVSESCICSIKLRKSWRHL